MLEVRRKVLLDLFGAPSTLLTVVGGLTALLASWGLGGEPVLTFGGVAAVLTGAGIFATRVIFGLDQMTEAAHEHLQQQNQASRDAALADLDRRLTTDNDPRTQHALRKLRHLHEQFQTSMQGGSAIGTYDVQDKVGLMFQVCVDQLEHSYHLWQTAAGLDGIPRQRIMNQREQLIQEVELTVQHIASAVQQYEGLKSFEKTSDLARLRGELDESLRAARSAERRMAEWEHAPLKEEPE